MVGPRGTRAAKRPVKQRGQTTIGEGPPRISKLSGPRGALFPVQPLQARGPGPTHEMRSMPSESNL